MATAGCTPDTTTVNSKRYNSKTFYYSAFTMPAGTWNLDSVSFYMHEEAAGTATYRIGVYSGGTSDAEILDAVKVWDSGEKTSTEGITPSWRTFAVATGSPTSATLTGGVRHYLGVLVANTMYCYDTTDKTGADTDFADGIRAWYTDTPMETANPLPDPMVGDSTGYGSISTTNVLTAYLTYSSGASGAAKQASYYRMLRNA